MASIDYKDLSGSEVTLCEDENPFQPLINASNDDPVTEPVYQRKYRAL